MVAQTDVWFFSPMRRWSSTSMVGPKLPVPVKGAQGTGASNATARPRFSSKSSLVKPGKG
jgi:hypothetical protein